MSAVYWPLLAAATALAVLLFVFGVRRLLVTAFRPAPDGTHPPAGSGAERRTCAS